MKPTYVCDFIESLNIKHSLRVTQFLKARSKGEATLPASIVLSSFTPEQRQDFERPFIEDFGDVELSELICDLYEDYDEILSYYDILAKTLDYNIFWSLRHVIDVYTTVGEFLSHTKEERLEQCSALGFSDSNTRTIVRSTSNAIILYGTKEYLHEHKYVSEEDYKPVKTVTKEIKLADGQVVKLEIPEKGLTTEEILALCRSMAHHEMTDLKPVSYQVLNG